MTNSMIRIGVAIVATLTLAIACGDDADTRTGDSPVDGPDAPAGEPDAPIDEPDAPAGEPDTPTDVDSIAASVVGMSEQEGTDTIEAAGFVVRVQERDGERFALTEDYGFDRVNLTISAGVITSTWVG